MSGVIGHTKRLTRRQAAVIGAFTGISCGPFEDIHEYVDSLPGFKGIGTISFAMEAVWARIKEACREDFLAICSELSQPNDVLTDEEVSK